MGPKTVIWPELVIGSSFAKKEAQAQPVVGFRLQTNRGFDLLSFLFKWVVFVDVCLFRSTPAGR